MITLRVKLPRGEGLTKGALFDAAASAASAMDYVDSAPGNALQGIVGAMERLRYARRRLKKSVGSVGNDQNEIKRA